MSKKNEDFYQRVYKVVADIPYGRVTTYGTIARVLGIESGARMVGYALNNLADSDRDIPAHRVVNRLGQLTGRGWFPGDTMKERLVQEGIPFVDQYTIDISACIWDPDDLEDE